MGAVQGLLRTIQVQMASLSRTITHEEVAGIAGCLPQADCEAAAGRLSCVQV